MPLVATCPSSFARRRGDGGASGGEAETGGLGWPRMVLSASPPANRSSSARSTTYLIARLSALMTLKRALLYPIVSPWVRSEVELLGDRWPRHVVHELSVQEGDGLLRYARLDQLAFEATLSPFPLVVRVNSSSSNMRLPPATHARFPCRQQTGLTGAYGRGRLGPLSGLPGRRCRAMGKKKGRQVKHLAARFSLLFGRPGWD